MRKLFAAVTMSISLVAVSAQTASADGMTVTDALVQAYKNSDSLNISRAGLRQLDEQVVNARAALKPQISGQVSSSKAYDFRRGSTSGQTAVTITGSQILIDGGRTALGIDSARMAVLAGRQSLVQTEQTVFLNALTAYMDLRRDIDALGLAQNNVRVLREQLRAARDRFDVGEVTRTDVSQTEARLASSVSNLELARGNVRISEAAFEAAVGVKPRKLHGQNKALSLPKTVQAAENIAVRKHPRVLEAQFGVKAAEYDLEAANLNKHITVSAQVSGTVSRSSSNNGDRDDVSARLQADVPIYSGGALKAQRRSALAALEQAKAEVQLNAVITRQNVNRAYSQWLTAIAAIKAVQSQIRSAEVAFEGVREEAKLGARTTLDALDAEQELLSARSSLISARRNEIVAAYSVLSEMGLLTADYLKLGIKTYDPDYNYRLVNSNSKLGERRSRLLDRYSK